MPADYLLTEANDWLYNATDPLFEEIKKTDFHQKPLPFVPWFNGVGPYVAVHVFMTSNIYGVFYCLMSTHMLL